MRELEKPINQPILQQISPEEPRCSDTLLYGSLLDSAEYIVSFLGPFLSGMQIQGEIWE